jgi:hypothetical protein
MLLAIVQKRRALLQLAAELKGQVHAVVSENSIRPGFASCGRNIASSGPPGFDFR